MELYLALDRGDTRRGVRRLEIERNVDFEIKGQFIRKLRDNTFSGNKNEDAHEHVGMILEIASLFNTLGVSGDAVILWVFPLTLTGRTKRWLDQAPTEIINIWDLLKRIFILRFCPPSKTSRRLEEILNFRQEGRETLYQAWERYNDDLFKCPTHDLNDYQKEESNRETRGYNSNQMSTITNKLKNLNRNMRNHKENAHAIKGWYEPRDEIYYLSSEEVKCVKETESREGSLMVTPGNNSPLGNSPRLKEILGKFLEESCKRQDIFYEWMKRFRENTNKNLRRHDYAIKGLEENVVRLAQAVKTHNKLNQDKTLDMKGSTIISPLNVNSNLVHCTKSTGQEIIKKIGEKDGFPYKTPTKEPGTFAEKVKRRIKEEQDKGERLLESIEKEPVNTPLINTIRKMSNYTKCLQELGSKKIKFKKCLRSMQSPKGIVETVLVKIDKFIFSMDFVILDIVEDNKVPIILGRLVLATAHARIDVFGRKISLEVGTEKVVCNANEGKTPLSICAINDFQVPEGFDDPKNVNELIEKGLTEVLFGKPFKECVGLEEDVTEVILWFKISNDTTIFNMSRALSKFSKLTTTQHNMMAPLLRINEEDKAK
ncbi:homeodomain-like protein [Tanacetum coccineum]|uniref:Homeodomain-like protein n=1 Tax=Tanacetum coccineum TaxID=301880 RepID=A0ABQ5F522_9ASTR